MHSRKMAMTGLLLLAGVLAAGCGPSQEQLMMAKALSARVDRQPTYTESAKFLNRYVVKHDRDYVMWAMDYSSLCLMGGNYDAAKAELLKCFMDIEKRQDTDKEKAAAISNESLKIFKGEPFERAMLCTYLGILHYMGGDYNNARIFCNRADMADATTEDNMEDFRHDFRLAHYWLGRTYLKLGDEGNAAVAFRKARQRVPRKGEERELVSLRRAQAKARVKRMRLEEQSFEKASGGEVPIAGAADMSASPSMAEMPATLPGGGNGGAVLQVATGLDEFLSADYQKQANLILIIETGAAPIKYLVGENSAMDRIMRNAYQERTVVVYLDGQKAGPAFQMVDMFHQADTRGTSEKDRVQITKGITKSILTRIPYVGDIASMWNVQADHRYWRLMPGEVHVFAAKVKPGTHTVSVQSFDSNGRLLPRHRLTRHHIPVNGAENIYFLHTKPEADNTYFPDKG